MLKQLTKYDYREQFCEALRNWRGRHGKGVKSLRSNRAPCAIGVGRIAGIFSEPDSSRDPNTPDIYIDAQEKLGIPICQIWRRNDDDVSLAEIADWIEAQP